MWLHDMNGGRGGGGAGGGLLILLFLLAYVATYWILGAKAGGIWGGVAGAVLSIGLPLLIDSGSNWFPVGAFIDMFIAWVFTLLLWGTSAIPMWLGARSRKSHHVDSDAVDSDRHDH